MKQSKMQLWRHAFAEVIEQYQEIKSVHGHMKSMNYEIALQSSGGGRNPFFVRPTLSDFLCEVEIQARRALTQPEEIEFFNRWYKDPFAVDERTGKKLPQGELNNRVMAKVGKFLVSRKVYPVSTYMRGRDVRG